ncbi:DNA-directed RNA polymerase subunit alpha [compost metagenome]
MKRANIYTVGDLLKKTERELMDIKNFGKKSAEEVIERMRAFGFHMASGEPSDELAAARED